MQNLKLYHYILPLILLIALTATPSQAQIGSDLRSPSDVVRIAQPGQLADTVNVWGAVGRPGRFLVPRNTTIPQILSYSGGPGADWRQQQAGVFRFFSLPQVEVYINRFDQESGDEIVRMFTYRFRDPFPEGMREYQLNNNEYVTVHLRQRPSIFEYVSLWGFFDYLGS